MSIHSRVLKAYGSAATLRNQRDQDAEVIRRVSGALRRASDEISRTRALADVKMLWQTILAASHDPRNPLPTKLCAQMISVAQSVLRTTALEAPDIDFLIEINDNFANGLGGRA